MEERKGLKKAIDRRELMLFRVSASGIDLLFAQVDVRTSTLELFCDRPSFLRICAGGVA